MFTQWKNIIKKICLHLFFFTILVSHLKFMKISSNFRKGQSEPAIPGLFISFVRVDKPLFVLDTEVAADNANRKKFSGDIKSLRNSIENFLPFLLRTIEREEECGTTDKCHVEAHTREIRVLVSCVSATGKSVFDVGT